MRRSSPFLKFVLTAAIFCILLPFAVLLLWSVTGRWPWPDLLPRTYTLRAVRELLFGTFGIADLMASSMVIAFAVALLGTLIGALTARATELYDFRGKALIRAGIFLPLFVPGTVFAMGAQITLIRLGLADTAAGVIIVHLVAALPYCASIMADVTGSIGIGYEHQAMVLGASPLRAFFQVTFPLLLPGVLSSLSMGFIMSYCQYFTTLMAGGGRVRTLALVLVPYIQSGDRVLSAVYSAAFSLSALSVFFILERLILSSVRRRDAS